MGKHFNDNLMNSNIVQINRPKISPLRERKDIVDSTSIVSGIIAKIKKEHNDGSNDNNGETITESNGVSDSAIT